MFSDHYPTRGNRCSGMFLRHDPVIHNTARGPHPGPLDDRALAAYRRDGFLWFRDLFSGTRLMDELLSELKAVEQDPTLMEAPNAVTDPHTGELRSIFGIHRVSDTFSRLTRHPLILGMVQQLLGGGAYIHQSRLNDKAGFSGGGFDWHSDFETWHAEDGMPRMRAVSASLLLSDNNEFNGPLMLVPGSHQYFVPCAGVTPHVHWQESLKGQRLGLPDKHSLRTLIERRAIRTPKGRAGSLLLFECNTLHASAQNLSPWPRANAFFVYNSIENRVQVPFCGTSPRPDYLAARDSMEALKA